MRNLIIALLIASVSACGADSTVAPSLGPQMPSAVRLSDSPAEFTVTCPYYNYCTFSNVAGNSGTWTSSQWGTVANGVSSFETALSTYNLATNEPSYETTITHVVGTESVSHTVLCKNRWGWKSMCRQVD